jgi:hypothetical protein
MTTTNPNGRAQRKSLADQIERFDAILDGLAESLHEAVATAVQQAVSQAVRAAVAAAVTELLTNAALLRTLQGQAEPVPAPSPSTLRNRSQISRFRQTCCSLRAQLHQVAAPARAHLGKAYARLANQLQRASAALRAQRDQLVSCGRSLRQALPGLLVLLWQLRQPLLLAVGIGGAVGLGCYLAGPLVASLTSGLCSIVLSLAAQALLPFRRLLFVGARSEEDRAEFRAGSMA